MFKVEIDFVTQRGKCVPKTVLSFNIYLFLYELEAPDLKYHTRNVQKENLRTIWHWSSGPRKKRH